MKERQPVKFQEWLKFDPSLQNRIENLASEFFQTFITHHESAFLVPGRAEALGGHTDYNQGYTISANIPQNLLILGAVREDNKVVVRSLNQKKSVSFNLDNDLDVRFQKEDFWSNYIKGVFRSLIKRGLPISGADLLIESNIPMGAGVSSSAAIEIATAKTALNLSGIKVPDFDIIKICKEAENDFVGVSCGYLDQTTVTLADQSWLFISHKPFQNLPFTYQNISLDLTALGVSMVLGFDPGLEHVLSEGKLEERKNGCFESIPILEELTGEKICTLRDISPQVLSQHLKNLSKKIGKRKSNWVRHIVLENERVKIAANALISGDIKLFGRVMTEAGRSAIFEYELGEECPQLGYIYEYVLREQKNLGVLGIRNMGGGFNPTTITLVKNSSKEKFIESVQESYFKFCNREYIMFEFVPAPPATML